MSRGAVMVSLGQRFYDAFHAGGGAGLGTDGQPFAESTAEAQAFWNRAAVAFTCQLSDFETEWDAVVEACAQAAEAQDRTGREWVRDSLWAAILRRAGENVRRLKRKPMCAHHPDRPSRINLDGDELCQQCADAWARGEGEHAAWLEAQEREGNAS